MKITKAIILVFFLVISIQMNSQVKYKEVIGKLSIRETTYMIRVPENWNGTLLNDLDYFNKANSDTSMELLNKGYAMSGTKRRKDRSRNYDPAHEAHDFISIFDVFESKFGKPKRIIQLGCSGGGTVTLSMAEVHSSRIDGAIAACAATSQWMSNTHLDALFVLKSLLAPELQIVDFGNLSKEELIKLQGDWETVLKKAQETEVGRARIALAITIGQWPAWGGRGKAPVLQPDSKDVKTLQESMFHSLIALIPSQRTKGTSMLEISGRGQLKSNVGLDYKDLFENGNKDYKAAVKKLYKEATASLKSDLKKINDFKRIAPDNVALKYWSAPGRTHVGQPKVPLLRIHTIGDGLVYPALAQGYEALVKQNGYGDLFRTAYVNSWGHCSFSKAEWIAAIETMMQRLDTGKWPNTKPEAMNQLAKKIDATSEHRFIEFEGVEKYNRIWIPTISDYKGGNR
ncbi:hypothetical protein MPF19_11355 [Polaribacter sp. Z014]|uniref:hypothetical protein n=1 Tax=Polaribacter sp. Z014 TaxID=2927126 RepID=UPI0020219C57|nr:hypothetical protein [Polaribacter sp. Z014]MCL7764016.1 hypothetical protein [Polaribacter sp. Z014]